MSSEPTDFAARCRKRAASTNADGNQPACPAGAGARPKGDRWATLNQFVDLISPHLSLAERAVWLVMFRFTKNSVCAMTARRLANVANIGKNSASRSLKTLIATGLVRVIELSTDKGAPSRYSLNPQPGQCLAKVISKRPK